jgi:hypothetical protein
MGSLARRPLLDLEPGDRPRPGWRLFTNRAFQFTVELPQEWQTVDGADSRQAAALGAALAQDDRLATAIAPFDVVADLEVVWLARPLPAADEPASAFVLVGQSDILSEWTIDEALALARNTGAPLLEAGPAETPGYLTFQIQWNEAQQPLRCFHSLALEPGATSFLAAACSEVADIGQFRAELAGMVSSFRRLAP